MWWIILFSAALFGVGFGARLSTPLEKDSWAFLVAGSRGFINYRHQADVSHAYHVMLAEGIPADRIIVMMYDDIAYHKENRKPGVIIHSPDGQNVYKGLKIDYRRGDVNSKTFLSILKGDKAAVNGTGTGRVIESDGNANIFVYFSDHGGPGLLCFPDDVLSAVELEETLTKMYENNRYNKLIMYIEACYSGSMFDNILQENTNVFVMTAAARDESSFAVYCDQGVCLGDEFSVSWMEQMDWGKRGSFETFFHQYQHVRSSVEKSHVQIYGDFSIGGAAMTPNGKPQPSTRERSGKDLSVDSKDVPLYSLRHRIAQSNGTAYQIQAEMELKKLIQGRRKVNELMERLVRLATADSPHVASTIKDARLLLSKEMFPCYMELLDHFKNHCYGHKHEYLIHHYYKLANICILQLDTTNLLNRLPALCSPYKSSVRNSVL